MIGRWERGFAVIAGAIGLLLIGAFFVGAVVLEWDSLTSSWRDDPWRMVLFGFAAAPFATALFAVFTADRPVLRAALLGAAASMAFLAMLLAAGSVGFVLFPLVVLLVLATVLAVLSLRRTGIGAERGASAMLTGVLPTLWLFGAASLFVFSANDGRCWELTRYADGTTTRVSIPYSNSLNGGSGTVAPGVVEVGQTCSSDVVTAREGVAGLAFLAAGIALTAFVARPPSGSTSASTRRTPAVTRG